jgi:hypothetical protein
MLLFLTACAGHKRPFQEIKNIPDGRGVVYIYMPNNKNVSQQVSIRVDNEEGMNFPVGMVTKGHHISFIAPEGVNLFQIGDKAIEMHIVAGQSYFIKIQSYKVFWSLKYKVFEVPPTAGFADITNTSAL